MYTGGYKRIIKATVLFIQPVSCRLNAIFLPLPYLYGSIHAQWEQATRAKFNSLRSPGLITNVESVAFAYNIRFAIVACTEIPCVTTLSLDEEVSWREGIFLLAPYLRFRRFVDNPFNTTRCGRRVNLNIFEVVENYL